MFNNYFLKIIKKKRWVGDWGLGIGDWGLGPIPNPQSPIPNPQSPLIKTNPKIKTKIFLLKHLKK